MKDNKVRVRAKGALNRTEIFQVEAMPDETAWSHARRLAWQNQERSVFDLIPKTSANLGRSLAHPALTLLAGGESEQARLDYFLGHSMAPLMFPKHERVEERAEELVHYLFQSLSGFPSIGVIRHCAVCSAAMTQANGFSWFTRALQLPGVDRCIKHGCGLQLRCLADTELLTSLSPEWPSPIADTPADTPSSTPSNSEFVERYNRIVQVVAYGGCSEETWSELQHLVLGRAATQYKHIEGQPWLAAFGRISEIAPDEWLRDSFLDPYEGECWDPRIWIQDMDLTCHLALGIAAIAEDDLEVTSILEKVRK